MTDGQTDGQIDKQKNTEVLLKFQSPYCKRISFGIRDPVIPKPLLLGSLTPPPSRYIHCLKLPTPTGYLHFPKIYIPEGDCVPIKQTKPKPYAKILRRKNH